LPPEVGRRLDVEHEPVADVNHRLDPDAEGGELRAEAVDVYVV